MGPAADSGEKFVLVCSVVVHPWIDSHLNSGLIGPGVKQIHDQDNEVVS